MIDPKADDAVAAIKALTHGVGVDLALDTSGAPEGRVAAVQATRPWGTVCFVGEGGGVTLDVSRDLLRKQLTILGSWTFSKIGQVNAQASLPTEKLGSSACSPTAGGWGRPRTPTGCSISRAAAKACL